jgi:hypothetical protein
MKSTATGDNDLITELISRAQAWFELESQRVLDSATGTRYFDAIEDVFGLELILDRDLASITTVTNGDDVEVTTGEYTTQPRNDPPYYSIKLLASSGKAWDYTTDPENSITVAGDWSSYATSSKEYKAAQHALIRLTKWMYKQLSSHQDLDQIAISPEGVLMAPAAFPKDIEKLAHTLRPTV